jgi:hypothetical protein
MGSNTVAEMLLVPFCIQMKQYNERADTAVSPLTQTSKLSFSSSDRAFCSFARAIQQYPHFSGFLAICYAYTSFGLVLTRVTLARDETLRVTLLKTWGGGIKSTPCVLGILIYEGIKLGRWGRFV